MGITVDDIKDHIPYYLTQEGKKELTEALDAFPDKMNYYTLKHQNDLLQGDGWNNLDIINLQTAERKSIKGIILSNSCDISSDNARDIPVRIVFAPIILLDSYEKLLIQRGIDRNKISSKMSTIKQQRVTSLFYLPKGGGLKSEYIAVLDDLHNVPAPYFYNKAENKKEFTLSQAGFYLFLLKLSIHFCRFHENVLRGYEQYPVT
ncbi:MAG: hypothetical protein ACL93V_12555 [Candidatus Electrothrix sp. YB6]